MSLDALEAELRKGDVGTVVVTLGTTAIGAVDPLDSDPRPPRSATASASMWTQPTAATSA